MAAATTKEDTSKVRKRRTPPLGIYSTMLITRQIPVEIVHVGTNIKETLEKVIASQIEGKCIVEGFIRPNSTKILTYSSGMVKGSYIIFEIVFECLVCSPVEGMRISCVVKNVTKAGIRAETKEEPSPVVIFIARDHHNTSQYFSSVTDGTDINVRVIGQRFELNDKYISIIAELLESREEKAKRKRRPKLVIKGED
jgi:DNA-directed RNA polymerase subunit E'/Rpb7